MSTVYSGTQGSQLYIMNPTVSPKVAVVVPQLQGIDGLGGKKSSIKLTNFDSVGYDEYAPGLVDPGNPNGNIVFDYNNTTCQLLQKLLGLGDTSRTSFFYGASDAALAPTVVTGVLTPPQTGSSPKTYTRSGWLFDGFVNEYTITAQVNNVVMAKFGAQATGARQLIVKGSTAPM